MQSNTKDSFQAYPGKPSRNVSAKKKYFYTIFITSMSEYTEDDKLDDLCSWFKLFFAVPLPEQMVCYLCCCAS